MCDSSTVPRNVVFRERPGRPGDPFGVNSQIVCGSCQTSSDDLLTWLVQRRAASRLSLTSPLVFSLSVTAGRGTASRGGAYYVRSSRSPMPTARTPGAPSEIRTGSSASPSHRSSRPASPTTSIHEMPPPKPPAPGSLTPGSRATKNGRNGSRSDSPSPVSCAVSPSRVIVVIDVPSRAATGSMSSTATAQAMSPSPSCAMRACSAAPRAELAASSGWRTVSNSRYRAGLPAPAATCDSGVRPVPSGSGGAFLIVCKVG